MERLYAEYLDSVVEYRKEYLFEEKRVSIKSKSVGLVMRLSGVISLLRNYSVGCRGNDVISGDEQQNDADDDEIIVLGEVQYYQRRNEKKSRSWCLR